WLLLGKLPRLWKLIVDGHDHAERFKTNGQAGAIKSRFRRQKNGAQSQIAWRLGKGQLEELDQGAAALEGLDVAVERGQHLLDDAAHAARRPAQPAPSRRSLLKGVADGLDSLFLAGAGHQVVLLLQERRIVGCVRITRLFRAAG